MSTGQWLIAPEGTTWFFDAGAESLDFAAAPEPVHGRDLGEWLAARYERLDATEASERDLTDARGLRAAITRLSIAAADQESLGPDDVDTVNLFGATPDIPPTLAGGRRQAGAGRLRTGQVLSTLARDIIAILSVEPERIRRCDAEDCRRVFRDESRTVNRRWCSMQRCGNRAKVRAHRARAAQALAG
ncbi:MAG: CGNR zinc finger domain-containing protein [Pseudolysinimonas sp.]|uniref:CGNR zinc finger domain-containing protein n=1 Tax=Pseudolysinimonas sp. TaxID=2680009 RepID=UPI0032655ECB